MPKKAKTVTTISSGAKTGRPPKPLPSPSREHHESHRQHFTEEARRVEVPQEDQGELIEPALVTIVNNSLRICTRPSGNRIRR